jgi:hypothetical protein
MPAEQTFCQKCNGPLRTIGGGPPGDGASPSAAPNSSAPGSEDLSLQLQGLQHEVQKSRRSLVLAGGLTILLSALLAGLLTTLHFYQVSQFARIDQLEVRLAGGSPGEAEIEFHRTSPGKVEFLRESAGRTETLIDHGGEQGQSTTAGPQQFTWSGGESGDFVIRVRTRDGWGIGEKKWVARDGRIHQAE